MKLSSRSLTPALAFLASLAICALVVAIPHFAHAQDAGAVPSTGLVPCGQDGPLVDGKQACGFEQVITLIGIIIRFLIFYVAPIIVIAMLLWGGFLILVSGGSPENVSKGKDKIQKSLIGLVIAMAAWIIIRFVLIHLGVDENVFPVFY